MEFKLPHITLRIIIGLVSLYVLHLFTGYIFIESIEIKLLELVLSISSYSLIIYIVKKSVEKSSLDMQYILGDFNFKEEKWKKMILIRIILLLFTIVFSLALIYIIQLLNPNLLLEVLMTPSDTEPFAYTFIRFFVLVTLAPIAEELYFRGYLLNKIGSKRSLITAVLISSFLFSILHIGGVFLPQFIGGIFYSLVYIRTRKLILPILLHALNNFLVGIVLFLPDNEIAISDMPDIQVLETFFLIGAILFIVLLPVVGWFVIKELRKTKGDSPYDLNEQILTRRKSCIQKSEKSVIH